MLYYTSIILTYVTHLGFLKSPHIILKAVLNIYNLCLAPVVNPVLTFYITLWRIVARTLGYGISFLHIIARFFNKHSSSNDNDKDTSNLESEQGPSSLPWNKSQSSLLSCFDNVSRKERATSGPKMGGSGGGLLKATIGSAPFSSDTVLLALQLSSLPFFLGSKVGAIPPHARWIWYACFWILRANERGEADPLMYMLPLKTPDSATFKHKKQGNIISRSKLV